LGLRAGSVDLVANDDVGEDRARLKLEVTGIPVPDRNPGHVGGEQVGGELDPVEAAVDAAGQRLRQLGLATPGTSSMRTWPSETIARTRSSTTSLFPWITVSTLDTKALNVLPNESMALDVASAKP
jgi:hypothetical protein